MAYSEAYRDLGDRELAREVELGPECFFVLESDSSRDSVPVDHGLRIERRKRMFS